MADRSRRARRQISDATDESEDSASDSGEDYDPRKSDSLRRAGRVEPASRAKRTSGGVPTNSRSSTSIQRSPAGASDDRRQSLKLTVKAPPSKLREVMRANEVESLQDTLGGGQVLEGPRSRRRAAAPPRVSGRAPERPRYAEYGESDIEDEEVEDEEEEDEEEEEEDEDDEEEETNDFEELGAEAEGGTDEDEEDVEMEDAPMPPKPPKITLKPPAKAAFTQISPPKVLVTAPNVGHVKSVEDQEMEDDPGDEEVENSSELSDDEDDNTNLNDEDAEGEEEENEEEDAQGEEEELEEDEELDEEDDDDDDSDETPASGSATPDLSRMTKRQRGRPEDSGTLMALDMAPQQRKFFTDAEKAMKKDEHARKRKELTKRKVQEEKTAALNRLLKPQASKARGAAPKPETLAAATAAAGSSVDEEEYIEKAHPLYTRWVSTKDGIRLGVPEEWLGRRVGAVFGSPSAGNGALVQEVE